MTDMLRHIILSLSLGASVAVCATDFECTPGNLSQIIGEQNVSVLKISGTADANDLFYLGSLTELRTLDISNLNIVASNGVAGKYAAATIPTGAFAGSNITELTLPENIVIDECSFIGAHITSLTIPANCTIATGAFSACSDLKEVKLSATSKLGSHAFESCMALADVDLGGLTSISAYAFANCTALTNITNATAVTSIGNNAFASCRALTTLPTLTALNSIGDEAFRNSGITRAMLKKTALKSLGDRAFANCDALTTVGLPQNCTTIGEGAFFDCSALENVNIPALCAEIPAYAFKDNESLSTLELTDSRISSINEYSFKGCGIAMLSLPTTLEYIGENAMEGMSYLTDIDGTRLKAVPELGDNVWMDINQYNVNLTVDNSLADIFSSTPQWQDFKINDSESDLTDISSTIGGNNISCLFDADNLTIKSDATLSQVTVYTPGGFMLTQATVDGNYITLRATNFTNTIIVVGTLPNGTVATIKLARRL